MSGLAAAQYRAQYDLAFQISPIILQGGIVTVTGGMLPISSITPPTPDPDVPFARYLPLPGATLVAQAIGNYSFANQAVAANATITMPLTVSLLMIAPVNQPGGYVAKLHAFAALQATLTQHNAAGGWYNVATPAFIYYNCLMTAMTDISHDTEGGQQQIEWQLDFTQPIISLGDAAAKQNTLMQNVSNGAAFTGPVTWSGNPQSSPATLTGVTAALSAFGGASYNNQTATVPSSGQ